MISSLAPLAMALAAAAPTLAQSAGSFTTVGDSKISAMMVSLASPPLLLCSVLIGVFQMFLGNDQMVYIMDKAEGNAAQINGHPAWGAVW